MILGLLAAMFGVIPSVSGQSFTAGQTAWNSGYASVVGQTFTPTVLGPNGSGAAPGPATSVDLLSITMGLGMQSYATNHNGPTTLAIIDASGIVGSMLATDLPLALYTSTSFTDLVNDPAFASLPTRTYNFSGATLTAGSTYAALYDNAYQASYQGAPSTYAGGELLWLYTGQIYASTSLNGGGYDLPFVASFAVTAVPEPATYAACAGLAALGFAAYRRRHRPA